MYPKTLLLAPALRRVPAICAYHPRDLYGLLEWGCSLGDRDCLAYPSDEDNELYEPFDTFDPKLICLCVNCGKGWGSCAELWPPVGTSTTDRSGGSCGPGAVGEV